MLLSQRVRLQSLGEFVDGHQYMFVASQGSTKRSDSVRPHMAKGHDGGMVHRA
jgi:hypothetical protein